ncbi:MAG: 3-phosphoshikimate 1-carboxyvinyltransferase [Anaerolineales bacterium]
MATLTIRPGNPLAGHLSVPGDKSISHRVLMLGALANGVTEVRGWLPAGDTRATLSAVCNIGATVERHDDTTLSVHGGNLQAPDIPLDFVNAGTGIRLMAGVMAGLPFAATLDGSAQLRRRPMTRVTDPLRQMGAAISDTDGKAPLHVSPAPLQGIHYTLPMPSAQVKSCILLAGLFANGPTSVTEPGPGRDHTENMLRAMGVKLTVDGATITVQPAFRVDHTAHTLTPLAELQPFDLTVPGDFSSAAFLIIAGALAAAAPITLTGINTNPRRTGLLDVLARMGATVEQSNPRDEGGEPVADLIVAQHQLQGTTVGGDEVVRMIDEFPALMVAATQAQGATHVREAEELRVKETDRIAVMADELRKMGATIDEQTDGFRVTGPQALRGAVVDAHDDHRIGMSLAIAALLAEGETTIQDAGCIHDSFPGFEDALTQLGVDLTWQN